MFQSPCNCSKASTLESGRSWTALCGWRRELGRGRAYKRVPRISQRIETNLPDLRSCFSRKAKTVQRLCNRDFIFRGFNTMEVSNGSENLRSTKARLVSVNLL